MKYARGMIFFLALLGLAAVLPAEEAGGIQELEEISVTGTRTEKRLKDSPVVTEVVGAGEIANSSAQTVTEILEDYGIMFTGNAMGDYVQLQGMGESRILYLIDGRRLVGRIASRVKGETMPLGNVERIEIVRGPQSALYGSDGIGGVINIITKKPRDRISLSAALSSTFLLAYDNPDTDWSPKSPFDNFDPLREQNLSVNIGFPLGPARNMVSLEGGRADFYLAERQSTSLLPAYYRGKAGFDTALALGESELRFGGSFMLMQSDEQTHSRGSLIRLDYTRADGYAEFETSPLADALLVVRLYDNFYQREKDEYNGIAGTWAAGGNHEHENITSLEIMGTWEGLPQFLFTAGLEGVFNFMDKYNLRNDGSSFAMTDRESIFFQAEYFREDSYSVIAGVRGERSSQFGLMAAPKVSAMYYLVPGLRLLAGAGLGYRAPDFSDLYLVKDDNPTLPLIRGNPDLSPEYALAFNLGLEYSKTGIFFLQVNGYYSELFNEIAYIDQKRQENGMNLYFSENILRSFRAGVDTEGKVTILKHAYFSAGYSWLYAYDRSEEAEFHPQPAHTVKAKAGWDYAWGNGLGINTYIRGRYFSPLDPDTGDSSRIILDFYAAFNIGKHFKISLAVDNLTGEINSLGPAVPQTFTVGLKYFF